MFMSRQLGGLVEVGWRIALPVSDGLLARFEIEAALLKVRGVRLVEVDVRGRTVRVGGDFTDLAVRNALSVLTRTNSGDGGVPPHCAD